ncbi:AAA family ATPase [Streptomyces sp. NPDC006326]|uniref:AAA family ATPase n=1 Tax=Streptomyces sp. NPDC006326 TaxID=3156752 RepID=UPI0033B5EB32
MPLRETEWDLVTTWVQEFYLTTLDPRDVLADSGFSQEFIGNLPLTNKSAPNAVALVRAARRSIATQRLLLEVLAGLPDLSSLPAGAEAEAFRDRLREDEQAHSSDQDHFLASVLRNGTEVFIDRDDLRRTLREFHDDPDRAVLVVDGEPDSGRSYTYSLIRHLGQHCGFRPVRVTLSRTSTAKQVVRRLAEFVEDPRTPIFPLNPAPLNDPLPSLDDDVYRLVSRATAADERFWFVLDECDKLDMTSDVCDCIGQLAQAVFDFTPVREETVPRLVLLGYGPTMRQLPYEIKNTSRDTARIVDPEDVHAFFRRFFTDALPPPADAQTVAGLADATAAAVLQAARSPGEDSYMRKLSTAAERAIRAYRCLRPGEDFAARLRQELSAGGEAHPPAVADARRAYREAACLLGGFDPTRLRLPGEQESSGRAGLELVQDCTTLSAAPRTTWALRQEVREAALSGLAGPEAARRVLEANTGQFPEEAGPERTALAYLSGRPPALDRQNADELADTLQAVLWLSLVPHTTGLPDPERVQRLLERARLLQPLRRLVAGSFCGRTRELEQLRTYAGLPAKGPQAPDRQPPLLIHGTGGMGKSTLIAKFLLDGLAEAPSPFPFAYVDFERPTLSVHEPATLIADIARQLGIQFPGHRAAFDELAGACEETVRIQREEQNRVDELYEVSTTRSEAGRSAAERFQSLARAREADLARRVAAQAERAVAGTAGTAGLPLVIAVDSFEEAQYRANPVLGRMWAMWVALQEAYPRLRFIVAGRATVHHPARAAEPLSIALEELQPEAAVELLVSCGVEDVSVARDLAGRIGGHPLSLKLAAQAAVLAGRDAASLAELVQSLPARRRFFYRKVDQMLVQGILYDRILKRIADREVRALAQAALALRTITPELVKDVLAEPCALRVDSLEEAGRLFGRLARLDMVEPAGPGAVRHRPDLRTIMLHLSDTARTDLMRGVGQRAVDYYAARTGPEARAEEIYHRLRLNENPRTVEQRWEPGVERYLHHADQDDMSPRSAAFLTGRLGGYASDRTMHGADQEDWERMVADEVEGLLAQGYTGEASARLAERRPWLPGSRLYPLLVETLSRSGRRAEAREVAQDAVDRAQEAGNADAQLELLLQSARLAQEDGEVQAAARDLIEAEDLATGLGRHFDAMGAMLARAQLTTSPGGDPELDRRLARQLRELPDEALAEQPVLVRAVAAEVGRQDPSVLDHTLKVVGLPEADDGVLDTLAESISRVLSHQPALRHAVAKILGNPADVPSAQQPEPARALREARSRGSLDRIARRLLVLRDQSGELLSGVATAMDAGNPAQPSPAPPPSAERNGPRAA